MFRSIQPCRSLRHLILPAQGCRKTGRASQRIEGSTALASRRLNMLSITGEAALCLQTDLTLSSPEGRKSTIPTQAARVRARVLSSRAVPLSRSQRLLSALARFTGLRPNRAVRARGYFPARLRDRRRRAVPLSRPPSVKSVSPRLIWVMAQASSARGNFPPTPRDRRTGPPRGGPSRPLVGPTDSC
jgi:hypothetical protein